MPYTDIDITMNKKIRSKKTLTSEVFDIRNITDVGAIARSLKNIILTGEGERRFDFNYGTTIFKSLFELMPLGANETFINLKIREKIQKYEPRVTLIDVSQKNDFQTGNVTINVTFKVKETQQTYHLPVVIQRNR